MRFRSIRSRLSAAGFCLVALPLTVMNAVWIYKSLAAEKQAYEGSVDLVNGAQHNAAALIREAANSYNKQLEQQVTVLLNVSQSVGKGLGMPHTQAPAVEWNAKNQLNQQETQEKLPSFFYGAIALSRNNDPQVRAPFVDDVRDLTGATCTVFQKMNAANDMLRVSTNVIAKNGQRATGTYIPAVDPDGKPNPVVSKVMMGQTFVGRAFVVDSWFVSAYTPITSLKGDIIGMLYVGIPERIATEDVQTMLRKVHFADSGRVLVFNTKGTNRGKAILSRDQAAVDDLNHAQGEHGNLLHEICDQAVQLRADQSAVFHYQSASDSSGAQTHMVRVTYYPAWDWVVAMDARENDLFAAPLQMAAEYRNTRNTVLAISLAGLAFSCFAWWIISGRISERISRTALEIRRAAKEVSASTEDLAIQSKVLDDSARVQNSAIERSSQLGTVIDEKSSSMAQAAGNAAKLMDTVREGAARSDQELKRMLESMTAIAGASRRVATIIKMIDEIALQTRMLALNAAVEAARAGAAGRSFSVVAEQVGLTAQRCSIAAAETNRLIKECLDASSAGEVRLEGLATRLVSMGNDLTSVTTIVDEVASMSREQSEELVETAQTLRRIKEATDRMNETARRHSGTTALLRGQGTALNQVIADLEILCGMNAAATAAR